MEDVNKYGLSRAIPSAVKRAVRQNSGFGCVFCGLSLYQYDHIDPPWANAREHRPESICLLCPNHHERKNKGLLSIEDIVAAYAAPKAKCVGYSHDPEFRDCRRPLKMRLGNVVFDDPTEVLRVGGEILLAVADLEDGHLALNGRFYDCNGKLLLEIYQNEWRSLAGNWDVERVGNGIVIREMATYLSLRVVAESAHSVTFDNIAMNYLDVGLVSSEGGPIEISYKGKPTMVYQPGESGGIGIETKGVLDIDASGCLRALSGPTTIGAGTLEVVGTPAQEPRGWGARPYVRSAPKVTQYRPPGASPRRSRRPQGRRGT